MPEWIHWTLAEGFGMGLVKVFGHGPIGATSPSLAFIILAVALSGFVQAIPAYLWAKTAKINLSVDRRRGGYIIGFAVAACLATICAFASFRLTSQAELAINTFISSVPGIGILAVYGGFRKFPGEVRPGPRQWIAVVAGMVGLAYIMLPNIMSLFTIGIPPWFLWSLGTMAGSASTEILAKEIAYYERKNKLTKLDPRILQVFGGTTMGILAFATFLLTILFDGSIIESEAPFSTLVALVLIFPGVVWLGATIWAGIGQFGWWTFRLKAFQANADITYKKFPGVGVYLLTAMLGGTLIYGNPLSVEKFILVFILFPTITFCAHSGSEKLLIKVFATLPKNILLQTGVLKDKTISPVSIEPTISSKAS